MLKIIKKTINILLVSVAILILLTVILFFVLRIPVVQTYVARGLTKYISNEIGTTVSVGKVEYAYFNMLILDNVLIKDRNNDTLLYAEKISAAIRQIAFKKGIFRLGKVTITRPVVGFITDSTGSSNLNWYLDKITSKTSDTTKNRGSLFHISNVRIVDGKFALINRRSKPSSSPIDFSDIRVDSINGSVEDLIIRNDSTMMEINSLAFKEVHGFRVRRFGSRLLLNKQNIIFSTTSLICDSSVINAGHIAIHADSSASFSRFLQEVRLDINLNKSLIYFSDIKYFVPFIKDMNESLWLSGDISGTVSELKGRNIHMQYKDQTNLECSFDLSGLPDIKNTFIFLEINDFRSISKDIEQLNIPGKGRILLPEPLRNLGVVSFSGTFTGFTTDFVAYGKINTTKGVISTDLSLRPEEGKKFRIKGLMKGIDIDMGSISGNSDLLGKITIETNVDGYTESFKKFALNVSGKIDSVDINNYRYRDIVLKGYFTDKAWDGDIKIHDDNINMELLGMFDFNHELPEFDFTMNLQKAKLYNLNIDKNDTTSSASMLLTANFKGNNIDNLDGEIKLLNSSFRKFGNNLEIYDFSLKTFSENNKPAISLRTDFVDINLNGRYSFGELGNVVKNIRSLMVPSRYGKQKLPVGIGDNNFIFSIRLKKTDELNTFLRTGLKIAENSTISGKVFPDSIISVSGISKSFSINSNVFSDLQFDAKLADTVADANIKIKVFNLSGLSDLKDLNMRLNAIPDHYKFLFYWDNKEKIINNGRFEAAGSFSSEGGKNNRIKMMLDLLPGQINIRDKSWNISPAEIIVDSTSVRISRFNVNNDNNYFIIDGAVSENIHDTLYMKFNGIDLSPLNNLYEKNSHGDDMIHLAIGGTLNGQISFTDLYRNFMFESNIKLKNFSLLNSNYGDISIVSVWNNSRKVAEMSASNNLDGVKMFDISGIYDPGAKNMDILIKTDKMPIDALNPLLKFFASGISGKASGKVRLSGEPGKPLLIGSLWIEDGSLKIDYLQAKYRFTDSIRLDKSGFRFNNINLKDEKGNTAVLNGTVFHNHFKDFSVDLTLKTNDCMVLNTKPKDNDIFYGTAFVSGLTTIKTVDQVLKFNISAKTGKNTRFYIPLNSSMSVAQNSFVSFVAPAGADTENKTGPQPVTTSAGGMEIAFDLEVTPEAEVQLIMDPKTGDIMKANGRGNLNISLNRKGVLNIFGDYTIENGDYLFTLGNIINKSFNVESGGKISFNGDVSDADIDIKAIYKTKASLYDIMPGILPESKQNERIPVECQLLLSGKLFNPTVGFDIYLPTADEETRAYLRSMIKSEEEMSRQFLFLLVMNKFYSTDQGSATQNTAGMGTATVGVTTMEMLSNQLSNWLSQISNDFDIGVVYRPGTTQLPNSNELQVALSTQLLNDKVVINGNFDVAGSQATGSSGAVNGTNSFTGVFNVEYKINEKIRFKFFNRSNDNFYIDNGIQYTQGLGLFYRQDFNKFKDLFKKSDKGDMKKGKKTKPVKTK